MIELRRGFPADAISHLRRSDSRGQFRQWARHSMAVSRFWYCAYPNLTTDQTERNYRVALGLRKATLSEEEGALWINDL